MSNLIIGSSGKGGGDSSGPVEAKNTLRSRQYARIIDALCEGEIEGLVGANISTIEAEKNIFIDGVALRNDQGVENFDLDGLSWYFVPGTPNQSVLPTGGQIASEVTVNQIIRTGALGGGPVIRSITDANTQSVRVTVQIPRLTEQDKENGNLNGSSVTIAIDVQSNGGGYVEATQQTISGKTNSSYMRSYEVPLNGSAPWDIRLRRITAEAVEANIQNEIYWSSYTRIVKDKLNYPNTALMGIKVDSALFSKIPQRGYRMRLTKVRVPNNYNPTTRAYTGLWDGTFSAPVWTDNPAWCWYDLVTDTRYGLGQYISSDIIDKWALYEISQYCDELVLTGFKDSGGIPTYEPRFTCNLILQTREEALKVVMNMASIFRGIVYWHTNSIYCSQDKPSDIIKLFTPANVLDGVFTYSGTARQARHTVALVSWNDPANQFNQQVEYVEDRDGIQRLGVREVEIAAMGCTSRGQAHRLGAWTLLTEKDETDTIVFRTGLEGCGIMPGQIFQTTDPSRAGKRMGGRLISATINTLTLDDNVTLVPGTSYNVAVILPSGVIEEKAVVFNGVVEESVNVLTLSTNLSAIPQLNSVWILQSIELVPELWRVISLVEVDDGNIEITGLEHIPGKYAAVEQNIKLEPRPTSSIKLVPAAVTNLTATTDVKLINELLYSTRIHLSWTPAEGAVRYIVSWRRDQDNYQQRMTTDPSIDIEDVSVGSFEFSVVAENAIGMKGFSTVITHVVDSSYIEADVTTLSLNTSWLGQDCPIAWTKLDWAFKYIIQVYDGATLLREEHITDNQYIYTYVKNIEDGGPFRSLTFKAKAVSWRGQSANWALLNVANVAPATPSGIVTEAGPGQVSISAVRPTDQDLAGMIVWMYTDSTVPTVNGNIIYKGPDNAYTKTGLTGGVPMYFKVAFYDQFGTASLNVSTSTSATPLSAGGIVMAGTLPANPAAIGGQTAVFLDTLESSGTRGLWGWDGSSWAYTRSGAYLVANSVTADRINATSLSSISANLGTITAGNITLSTTGYIRGGATAFNAGTGIWQGYDSTAYKFRIGNPTGARLEWNGTDVTIYNSSNSPTLSSGGAIWSSITGVGKPADNATRNVYIGAWASSTAYLVGDIVIVNGTSWTCREAHTASALNQPPSSGSINQWWGLLSSAGNSALFYDIYASSPVITKDVVDAATTGNYSSITVQGKKIEGVTTTNYGWITVTANGDTEATTAIDTSVTPVTIAPTTTAGKSSYLVKLYNQATVSGATLLDSQTVPVVFKGATGTTGTAGTNAINAVVSNEAHVFNADNAGVVSSYTGSSTDIHVYEGITELTYDGVGTANGTWKVIATPTNITTGTLTDSGAYLTIGTASAITADTASISFAISGKNAAGNAFAITKVQNFSKAKAGAGGSAGAAGANAINAILSNEVFVFVADSAGTISSYTGSGTQLRVYEGTTELTYDGVGTANSSWAVAATPTNITTGSLTDSGTYLTVGNASTMTSDTANISYAISGKNAAGNAFTLTKTQQFSKSKAGATGPAGASGGSNYATAEDWVPTASNIDAPGQFGGNFVVNGDGNSRVWGTDPFGKPALIWRSSSNDVASDADGGWNKTITGLSPDVSYLSYVYFRRTSSANEGYFYHGLADCLDLTGAAAVGVYFSQSGPTLSAFIQNEWYVAVGVIQANSSAVSTQSGISGIYRVSNGVKVINGTDYRMGAAQTTQTHRTYLYYSTNPAVTTEWWGPGFYEINGNEPTLSTIIGRSASRGPATYLSSGQTSWSDAVANSAASELGGPIHRDIVIEYSATFSQTKYYDATNQTWNDIAATVNGNLLVNGTINANKLVTTDVYSLTMQSTNYVAGVSGWIIDKTGAFEANTGTFRGTLSAVTGNFGNLTVATNGSISSGQTAFNTGSGFWLGNSAGVTKFSIGNPTGNFLAWDGTSLKVTSAIDVQTFSTAGTFTNGWVKPAFGTRIRVEIIGGGGGGGASACQDASPPTEGNSCGGGGGGGGGFFMWEGLVTDFGATVTVVVGAGGVGGQTYVTGSAPTAHASKGIGTSGNPSSFGTLTVSGGGGGASRLGGDNTAVGKTGNPVGGGGGGGGVYGLVFGGSGGSSGNGANKFSLSVTEPGEASLNGGGGGAGNYVPSSHLSYPATGLVGTAGGNGGYSGGGGGGGGTCGTTTGGTGGAGGTSMTAGAGGAGGNGNYGSVPSGGSAGGAGIAPGGGGGGAGGRTVGSPWSGYASFNGGAGAAGRVRITVY